MTEKKYARLKRPKAIKFIDQRSGRTAIRVIPQAVLKDPFAHEAWFARLLNDEVGPASQLVHISMNDADHKVIVDEAVKLWRSGQIAFPGVDLLTADPTAREPSQQGVPSRPERLLAMILSPDKQEEVLGDLAELHARHTARHGQRFADHWYWTKAAGIGVRAVLWWAVKIVSAWELFSKFR